MDGGHPVRSMETIAMERIDALRLGGDAQDNKAYRGARRAGGARRKRGAAALAVAGLATVVLGVQIGVVAMPSERGTSAPTADPDVDTGMALVPAAPGVSGRPVGSVTSSPTVTVSPGSTPSPSGSASVRQPTPSVSSTPTPSRTPGGSASSVAPVPSATAFAPFTVQAEDPRNELHGDAQVVGCPTCDGGARVRYIQGASDLVVNLTVPVAGMRRVTVRYESGNYRPLQVSVNGGAPYTVWGSGAGDWDTPADFSISTYLPAGQIRIRLYHETDPAVDVDSVTVS